MSNAMPKKIRFWDTSIRLRAVKLTLSEGETIKCQQYDKKHNELVTTTWAWPIGDSFVFKFVYCDGGLGRNPYHERFVCLAEIERTDGKYPSFRLPVNHRFSWQEVDWKYV